MLSGFVVLLCMLLFFNKLPPPYVQKKRFFLVCRWKLSIFAEFISDTNKKLFLNFF